MPLEDTFSWVERYLVHFSKEIDFLRDFESTEEIDKLLSENVMKQYKGST